jgi:hypothetical protein
MTIKKYRSETNCLNCGSGLTGKFCSQCGQENVEIHENFFHLVGHFVSDYLHFDSKFFRSVVPLFIKPGFLTKEFWAGRRTKYIHPLRIFFFVTILFAVASTVFYKKFGDTIKSGIRLSPDLEKLSDAYLDSLPETDSIYLTSQKRYLSVPEVKKEKIDDTRQLRKIHAGVDLVFVNLKYVTFFLLPLYALIFKILYRRSKKFYVDHIIYTIHLQTFAYCLFAIMFLIPLFVHDSFIWARQICIFILLIYIGLSLRNLYKQPWWKTILKSLIATGSLIFFTSFIFLLLAFLDAIFIQ